MKTVAAFTGGRDVPSARFRIRQYIEPLRREGIDLSEYPAPLGMFPPKIRLMRPFWGAATLASRIPGIAMSHGYDMTLFQREMISTLFTLERLARRPRLLDVDDAIWLLRGNGFAERLAGSCDAVICGNAFLAENFSRWNSRVAVIPTAVDTERYVPGRPVEDPVIGWSGVSSGLRDLYAIEPALSVVLERFPGARLRIVSDTAPSFRDIRRDRIEFIRWSQDNEVQAIRGMAIGIMPLEDSPWARGKCSYKMLTYMASGLPVVASPIGMNVEVLSLGEVGFGPRNADEWIDSLTLLSSNATERARMGGSGRRVAVERYSTGIVVKQLAGTLLQLASSGRVPTTVHHGETTDGSRETR